MQQWTTKRLMISGLLVFSLVLFITLAFWKPFNPGNQPAKPEVADKDKQSRKPRVLPPGQSAAKDNSPQKPYDYGTAPQIKPDANPQVASVAEALSTKTHPERLTPNILPATFNEKAYWDNPQAYLDIVEPGRIWQVAQPGKEVKRIVPASPGFQFIEQHTPVTLRVKVLPGAPVTFTSFDMGQFENLLTSVTVKADDQGFAKTQFTATGGTYGTTRVMAGSPLTADHAHFAMEVLPQGELQTFLQRTLGVPAQRTTARSNDPPSNLKPRPDDKVSPPKNPT